MTIDIDWEPDALDDIADDETPAPEIAGPIVNAFIEANQHLRRIARLRAQMRTLDAVYAAELARLRERHDYRRGVILRQIAWHEAPCIGLHARLLADDPTRKSIELPYGTLKSRTPTKPTLVVDDEAAFIAWANDHMAELVRTVEKPDLRQVSKAGFVVTFPADDDAPGAVVVPDTGERVPGIVGRREHTAYSVVTEGET